MEKLELIFIPSPLMGHATQALQLANLMINRFDHLSATVLIMKLPVDDPISTNFMESLGSPAVTNTEVDRIRFHHLPPSKPTPDWSYRTPGVLLDLVIEDQKDHVRNYLAKTRRPGESTPAAALVLDMFCTTMMDVGNEFGIPTYVFFTSGAALLQLMFHFQILHDEQNRDVSELSNSDTELVISGFANPVPPSVLPFVLVDKYQWSTRFLRYARAFRKVKGIIVNTFVELESHTINSFNGEGATKTPPIYPVGPIINNRLNDHDHDIMRWLDDQPRSSVVFLCFGSMRAFDTEQVIEIAHGVKRSGYRFLWSLRQPVEKGKIEFSSEYSDFEKILPENFFEQTVHVGKVIGWAPQMKILGHEAVGGFVSHCGWNSILESLWHGVPIATWPIYAEQQLNAFQMVRELGLSVEIKLDYNNYMDINDGNKVLVRAEEIERGIRSLMDGENEVREKVKGMREKSRRTMEEGGSSYKSLERLIENLKV